MWPRFVDWQELRYGVEIEFVGGDPLAVALLPGWVMAFDELQIDEQGCESGSELKPPPILWRDREQIREMLARLRAAGARANWSCGLHVHVGLEPWGQDAVLPLVDAALEHQEALQASPKSDISYNTVKTTGASRATGGGRVQARPPNR